MAADVAGHSGMALGVHVAGEHAIAGPEARLESRIVAQGHGVAPWGRIADRRRRKRHLIAIGGRRRRSGRQRRGEAVNSDLRVDLAVADETFLDQQRFERAQPSLVIRGRQVGSWRYALYRTAKL